MIQNQRFRPNGEVPPPAAATRAAASGARKAGKKAPPPVTAHRLFPAVVGLWFAALFGIGSFVVPPTLFEGVVTATGLPSVLPAAAPPLGFTARALLALVLTFAGGLAGLMIGLRFARSSAPVAQRKTFPGKPVRAAAPAGRRAAFKATDALSDDAQPAVLPPAGPATRAPLRASETFAGIEPLGAASTVDLHDFTRDLAFSPPVAQPDFAGPVGNPGPFAAPDVDADTGFAAEPDIAPFAPFAEPAPFGNAFPSAVPDERPDPILAVCDEPAAAPEPPELPELVAPAADPATVLERARRGELNDADALIRAPLAQLGTVQLIERLAMAMADWRDRVDQAARTFGAPVAAFVPSVEEHEALGAAVPVQALPADLAPFAAHSASAAPAALADMPPASEPPVVQAAPVHAEPPIRPALFDPPVAGPAHYDWDDDDDEPALPPRFLSSTPEAPRPALAAFEPRFAVEDAMAEVAVEADCADEADSADEDASADGLDVATDTDGPAADDGDPYPSLLSIGQPLLRAEPRRQPLLPEAAAQSDYAVPDDRLAPVAPSAMAPFAQPGAPFAATSLPQSGPASALPVAAPAHPVEPIDPVEADLALRTALANLQRMSGGAR